MDLFTVYVRGFGDNEDAYYACGTFKSKEGADKRVTDILYDWSEDGGNIDEVDYYIEEHELDV